LGNKVFWILDFGFWILDWLPMTNDSRQIWKISLALGAGVTINPSQYFPFWTIGK
jgi:opacity protein-like surface antigen